MLLERTCQYSAACRHKVKGQVAGTRQDNTANSNVSAADVDHALQHSLG